MGDALLFISRDAELIEPNTLYALSSQGEREGAAAAGCMLISPQGALIAAGGAISKDGKIIYPADNERLTHTVRTVSVLSGACMYMRADMYFQAEALTKALTRRNTNRCCPWVRTRSCA